MIRSCVIGALVLAAAVGGAASAHEMWLKPKTFRIDGPGTIAVDFLVGDGADVEHWKITKQRVTSLRTYGPGGVTDQMPNLREGEDKGGATVSLAAAGDYVVAMESSHSFLELAAPEFNAYVKHEGVMPIANNRTTPEAQAKPGREMYSRRTKALVRVGKGGGDAFTRPIGMTLEIVPEKSPYDLSASETFPVRVYYHGAPLAGATITLFWLDKPADPPAVAKSDAEGRAGLSMPHQGSWMASVVWSEPLPDKTHAEYDTTFSSLTFGFEGGAKP